MRAWSITCALLITFVAFAGGNSPETYEAAKSEWEKTKDKSEYQSYLSDFIQFNNQFHLDEKDGCYSLGKEPVQLMLVIKHRQGEQYAQIERVLADGDTAKASCFKKTYQKLKVGVPPYLPFVLQMDMG